MDVLSSTMIGALPQAMRQSFAIMPLDAKQEYNIIDFTEAGVAFVYLEA
jgi:hypothetical protein